MQQTDQTSPARRIIHVSIAGDDGNDGSLNAPLRHINTAAQQAHPGDTVRVFSGIYRERVDPPRGGLSDAERITYEAAEGAVVELRGSELVTAPWTREDGHVWCTEIPNTVFADKNPFAERISGDWFLNMGRPHHTAAVYVTGRELREACERTDLQRGFWYAEVGDTTTRLWIHWPEGDPNELEVEFNVRTAVFYPSRTGVNFITVRGFHLRHGATNWAPPTAEQIGLIGTHWSKGWIIENCIISHSRCVGITLGKYGDEFDNTSANSAGGYVETIERALERGWDRERIGSHIVRNNTIAHCGQAGIVGSLGAIFSEITDNVLHDIHMQPVFDGAEQAAIKFHAPIDTLIAGNHIYRTVRALWMDWMTQGTRITRNVCHDNTLHDFYCEVNHGPFVVDHNLFLSPVSLQDWAQGGAYIHNLFGGRITRLAELGRSTPWHPEHSTEIAGITNIQGGDERYFNNLFVYPSALEAAEGKLDGVSSGKLEGHQPFPNFCEDNTLLTRVPEIKQDDDGFHLKIGDGWQALLPVPAVSTPRLGKNHITGLLYKDFNGSDLDLSVDFFGRPRTGVDDLVAGPFAASSLSAQIVKVAPPPSPEADSAPAMPQLV